MSVTHDTVFKSFLTDVLTARDFLSIYLPEKFLSLCDLSTLRLEPNSFLDPELRAHISDIVYSVQVPVNDGRQQAYIFCLIEHQSTPDRWMAFRQIRYAISLMHNHISQGHDYLPLVIPVLFYHGTISPYPFSANWLDLFPFAHADLAKALYVEPFPLVDVTVIPDDEILGHKRVALLELVQKHIRQRDMMQLLNELVSLVKSYRGSDEQLEILLRYLIEVGDTANPRQLIAALAENASEYKEVVMTIAQRLQAIGEEIGEKRGKKLGEERGKKIGEQKGRLEVIRDLLASGLNLEDLTQRLKLTEEEIIHLKLKQ